MLTQPTRVRVLLLPLALAFACGGKSADGDGGSGGQPGSGGADGGGGTAADDGGSATSCGDLEQQYQSLLAQARVCDPANSGKQCSALVDTELACPCATYVNPANADALQKLAELKLTWAAQECVEQCPAVVCQTPDGAECQPGRTGVHACFDFVLE